MGSKEPSQPWTTFIRERVSNGPVSYEKLIAEAAALVPPGRAYRDAIDDVEGMRRRYGHGERNFIDAETKKDQRIRYGQRSIAGGAIRGLTVRKRLAIVEENGQRIVTLGPHPWTDPIPHKRGASELSSFILYSVESAPVLFEDLFEQAMDLIPREQAIEYITRKRDFARENRIPKSGKRLKRAPISDDDSFRSGAREIFRKTVRSLIHSERVSATGSGPSQVISRGPNWVSPEG